MDRQRPSRSNIIYLVLILIAVTVCYSGSLNGEFQFDDYTSITGNEQIKDLDNFFRQELMSAYIEGGRPVTKFTFAVNYAVGEVSVFGYHLSNILIHLAAILLVYLFTKKTLRLSGYESPEIPSLIVAFLFGIHPVQSEAVSYISQRSESLASVFYLASLLLLIKTEETGFDVKGIFLYVAGLSMFIVGIGAKEIIITLPAVYLLFDFYFMKKKRLLKRIAGSAPLIISGLMYIALRSVDLKENASAGFGVEGTTTNEYLLTQFSVIVTYLRVIFFPFNQNLDYDFPVSSYFLLILLAVIVLAFVIRRKNKVASFGIMWFFVVISPTSSFIPIVDVIFEHRIYLALWGIVLAVTVLLYEGYLNAMNSITYFSVRHKMVKNIAIVIVLLATTVLGAALYERNRVWQTKMSLWSDVVSKSPNKARAHNNLGNCYFIQHDFITAIPHYKRAIEINHMWHESYFNLAMSLENIGRDKEAIYYYLTFAKEAPSSYDEIKERILQKYGLKK
jgi:hypothetical protein